MYICKHSYIQVCAEACAPLRQAVEECLSVLLPLVLGERYSILLAFMQDDLGVGEGGGADFSRAEEVGAGVGDGEGMGLWGPACEKVR